MKYRNKQTGEEVEPEYDDTTYTYHWGWDSVIDDYEFYYPKAEFQEQFEPVEQITLKGNISTISSKKVDSNQEFKVKPKIVDSNEPSTIRGKLLEYGWQQNRLYSADYSFFTQDYKKVGIERKTVSDLVGSIGDRLSNQFEKMCEQYDFKILLIEGSWQTTAQQQIITSNGITQWMMSTVWNYIRSWSDRGVTLELTSSEGHTIRRVNELYAYYQKSYHTGGLNKGSYNDDRILAFPTGCRGKTAANVLKNKSLLQVAKMSIDELRAVEGIGEVKAQSIFNHFRIIKEEKQERLEE